MVQRLPKSSSLAQKIDRLQSLSGRDQYDVEEEKDLVPKKPIALALILLVTGSVCLFLGLLHLRGHIYSKDGAVSFPSGFVALTAVHQLHAATASHCCFSGMGLGDPWLAHIHTR